MRDTGIGMTPEQVSRLFLAFEQADMSTTRKYGGTGLGLSICKRLTELMGGEIGVSSEIDVGTTFTFSIQFGIAEHAVMKPIVGMSQLRALVVDDHPMALVVLGKTLRSWGCDTATSDSSPAALRMIIEAAEMGKPFELILLDWQMPEMDGFELARRIEVLTTQAVLPRLPRMIMVTAHGKDRTDQALANPHLFTILEKPVLPSQLYDAIADLPLNGAASAALSSSDKLPWAALTAPVSGAHILLAEDNSTNVVVASEFLRVMGMQVDVAVDGQEAVEKVLSGDYDLVLMDLQMPAMDGFEATAAIRSSDKGKNLPIVAMTAAAMSKDRQATEAAGMNDHIAKPINPELLAKTLLKWLPKRTDPLAKRVEIDDEAPFSLPGLDLQSAWQRLDQHWSLVRKVCLSFVKDFTDAPAQLDEWIQVGDFAAAARMAHTVKGLAPNLGASELQRIANDFEAELKLGQSGSQSAFTRELSQVLAALEGLAGVTSNPEPQNNTGFDPASILPQLRELETMLLKKQGKARKAVKDIELLLVGSALENAFKGIVSKTERLKFEEALPLLKMLIQQLSDFAI
jgi:CheY-like chemotaxis protein